MFPTPRFASAKHGDGRGPPATSGAALWRVAAARSGETPATVGAMDVFDLAFGILAIGLAAFTWWLGASVTRPKEGESVYEREERKTRRVQFGIGAALLFGLGVLRIAQAFFD